MYKCISHAYGVFLSYKFCCDRKDNNNKFKNNENPLKYIQFMENTWKCLEIRGNTQKYVEIHENT